MCAPGDPPVSTTAPLTGSDADAIAFGPRSGSVSLVSTATAVAPASSATVAPSSTAVGAIAVAPPTSGRSLASPNANGAMSAGDASFWLLRCHIVPDLTPTLSVPSTFQSPTTG